MDDRLKKIGIFLGVGPFAGGMFQYTLSVLDASRLLHSAGYEIQIAYVAHSWETILSSYPFGKKRIRAGWLGLRLAELSLIMRLSGSLSRKFAWLFNPIPIQLYRRNCDAWIFPAQDNMTYQVRLPTIATIHDLMHRYEPSFPEVSKKSRRAIRDHRCRNLVDWSVAVLVDSYVGRKHVIESYGADSRKIYPLPYVPTKHILDGIEPEDFDVRYNLPKKFLFYPAQFWAHKNHKILIDAAIAIKTRIPDICIVFTGMKKRGYEDIRNYAMQLKMEDRIVFAGYVPDRDLIGFYRRARAMIMPTLFGPTNIPPLEAFACDCPVAVSNVYGMSEQVGDAALLFNPHSVEEISNVMEKLWCDDILCKELVAKGRLKNARWGEKHFGEALLTIIRSIDSLT